MTYSIVKYLRGKLTLVMFTGKSKIKKIDGKSLSIMWNVHTSYRLETQVQSGPPHRKRVVHTRPKTLQRQSVAKPETLLLIILRILCKYDVIDVHGS